MAKQIPVLSIESDCLRAVRLTEEGKEFVCDVTEEWLFAPPEGEIEQNQPEDGGESAVSEEDAVVLDSTEDDALASALRAAVKRFGTHEFALALPLSRFLAKVASVPEAERDTLGDVAQAALDAISPFPDDPLTVGVEIVAETDDSIIAVAAALPEASSPDVVEALESAKIRVTRVDVTALGALREYWPRILSSDPGSSTISRRIVLLDTSDGWDLVVLDNGAPTILRGLGVVDTAAELGREVMLSLLQGCAGSDAGEVVVFTPDELPQEFAERLAVFAPVRVEKVENTFAAVEGCARRAAEGATLDATPEAWAVTRNEARFKKRLAVAAGAAVAVWLVVMGVLFGVPFAYDMMRDSERAKTTRHAKAYKAVKDMRDKVKLVQRYSDHARGALEMFKAVSDRMPDGITLTSFQYKRGVNVHVTGEADQPTDVYQFKERFDQISIDDDPVFVDVRMPGVSGRGGKNKFDIDASFEEEDS